MKPWTLLQLAFVSCLLSTLPSVAAAADVPCQSCWTDACPKLQGLVPKCPPPPLVCKGGREKVNGHCCFPGQTWSGSCKGLPEKCPDGYVPSGDDCQLAQCRDGRERAADKVHCCWPGQKWNYNRQQCHGNPRACPPFWSLRPASPASNDPADCIRPPDCGVGQTRLSEIPAACCFPGQTWRDDRCAGLPSSCPPGFYVDSRLAMNTCSKEADCPVGQRAGADTQHNCCWPGQTWELNHCAGRPTQCPDGMLRVAEACLLEPKCTDGKVGSQATQGRCCWPGQTWETDRCAGKPSSCPAPYFLEGESCVKEARCPAGLVRTPGTQGACCPPDHVWLTDRCVPEDPSASVEPKKPFYRTGWFWGVTIAGVTGLALGLGLGLGLPQIPASHEVLAWKR